MFDLSGQFAIITGAASGIGEVIATRLADAGATVCVVDIEGNQAAATAERIGRGACSVSLDITNPMPSNALSPGCSPVARSSTSSLTMREWPAKLRPSGNSPTPTGTRLWPSTCMDLSIFAGR